MSGVEDLSSVRSSFGCDVGQFSESSTGIMDTKLFEYEVGDHSFTTVSPIVIIYNLCRTPLTFCFHSRKPTACTRMSPQWLTQWSSLVSISISKAECLCVQSRQHGRLLLGSALPASFVLNSLRSTRTSMPLLSLSCRLLLTGLTGDNCAYDFLFSSTRRDKARAQSYSRDSSRWLQDRTYWWNAS